MCAAMLSQYFFEFIYIFVIYKFSFHLKSYWHHVQAFFLIRNLITLLSCRNSTTSCIQSLLCSFSSCTGTRSVHLRCCSHVCSFHVHLISPIIIIVIGRHVMKTLFCCKQKNSTRLCTLIVYTFANVDPKCKDLSGHTKIAWSDRTVTLHFCQWGSTCQHKNETIVIYYDLGTKKERKEQFQMHSNLLNLVSIQMNSRAV